MIIAIQAGSLAAKQKEMLIKKGYIIIECKNPDAIRVINPEVNIDTNDYFMSALYACTVLSPTTKQEHFVNELYKRLKLKEANGTPK